MMNDIMILADQIIPQNAEQFFALVWRVAAIVAALAALAGLVMMCEGMTMDHRDGTYKKVLTKGAVLFLIPTICSMFIVMFYGIPAPVLNWG